MLCFSRAPPEQISFDHLICVIRPTLPFPYGFHFRNFSYGNSFLSHAARANASRAVLPSTIKPVKSYKFQLLFSKHLRIFVPRDRPASRGCTPRPSQRPPGAADLRSSLRICFPFILHGAERPSTFLIADRNLRSLPSPACASAASSRRGWPTGFRRPSPGAAERFDWDNKSAWRSARPRLRRFRLPPGLQGWDSGRGRSPNHCPDVVVASDQPRLMSSCRVHTLHDFSIRVSSVSSAT